jgi:hypothetical protein
MLLVHCLGNFAAATSTFTKIQSIDSDYIHPYFSDSFHPVHTDGFLSIGVSLGAFCVIDITPNEVGLVTPETEIMVVARPGEGTCDFESIDNPLKCASKTQKL